MKICLEDTDDLHLTTAFLVMLYHIASHLLTLEEHECESECEEGDKEWVWATCKETLKHKKWVSCIKFLTQVLYQHFVEMK